MCIRDRLQGDPGQVADGAHAGAVQPLLGGRADAAEPAHRQGVQELQLLARRDHGQAVGLVQIRPDLGEQLGGRRADRAGDPAGGGGDPRLQVHAEADHTVEAEVGAGGGEINIRLVDADLLDQRGHLGEQAHHHLAGAFVGGEARRQVGRGPWSEPAGLGHRHRRAHAEDPRLIRRGGHHAPPGHPADDHRLPAQGGLVTLLDSGEHRVEVNVQNARIPPHDPQPTQRV